jgi:superfamily II RNA helicase
MAGRAGRRGIDKKGYVYANIDNEQDAPNDVKRVMYGTVEEVTSQFKLSYATILRLYSRLGDGIYDACEKSFAYFRHKRKKGEHYLRMVSLVRRRIQLLQELGYLEGQVLTAKGQFCAHIYGYEVELTELFFGDLLPTLEPPMLAIVLVAISFEAKRDAFAVNLPNRVMRPLVQNTGELLHVFREAEIARRLPPIKRLDFTLSRVVHEWALGADFERLAELTDIATGDIVRAIRMGIQLIRQLSRPLKTLDWPGEEIDKLRKLLHATRECLKRGEIDAERQLRRSIEAAEEEARAGGEETPESGKRAPMYAPSAE